jgi:hypothetical protein
VEEIWKDVTDYEGLYQVSDLGNIRSLDREVWGGRSFYFKKGDIKKQIIGTTGYYTVMLYKNNKHYTTKVHRIVAMSFIANPNKYNVVNHLDGNKLNNKISNLEWCTYKQNSTHAFSNGLVKNASYKLRKFDDMQILTMATYYKILKNKEIYNVFSVGNNTLIPDIKRGHCYKHLRSLFE